MTSKLSSSQKRSLEKYVSELQAFVKKYKISPELVEEPQASLANKKNPGTVFSRVSYTAEGDARLGDALVPGFLPDESADEFHISQIPHTPGAELYPYMEITFDCHVCSAEDDEGETECENCEGDAEFIYVLSWDSSGKVIGELF